MAKKDLKIELPQYSKGSLFTTQATRDEIGLAKIREIPLREIDPFPNHPFKVVDDENMDGLVESIRENGVLSPALVRKSEDGRYQLISGHRRKRACELLGLETLRCEVVDISVEEATIHMVESNMRTRPTILPSERAFAYRMQLEAMKRQGKRTDLTSGQVDPKLSKGRSRDALAEKLGVGSKQIHRYIRLTNLIPPLLEMVDKGDVAMAPAEYLSYLTEEQQEMVLGEMEANDCTPSTSQAKKFKGMAERGELSAESVNEVLEQLKPNQIQVEIDFDRKKAYSLIPSRVPLYERAEYVYKAIEFYNRYLERQPQRNNGYER